MRLLKAGQEPRRRTFIHDSHYIHGYADDNFVFVTWKKKTIPANLDMMVGAEHQEEEPLVFSSGDLEF